MLDDVCGYLEALRPHVGPSGIIILERADATLQTIIGFQDVWQRIKEGFEAGEKPRSLAAKFRALGITPQAISARAYKERWKSMRIGRKVQVKHVKGFIFSCVACNQDMHATHGNKKMCDVCTAKKIRENEEKAVDRDQAAELNKKGV